MAHALIAREYALRPQDLIEPSQHQPRRGRGWRLEDRPVHLAQVGRWRIYQGYQGLFVSDEQGQIPDWTPYRCRIDSGLQLTCGHAVRLDELYIRDDRSGEGFCVECFGGHVHD